MSSPSIDHYSQLKEYLFQGHNVFLTGPGGVGKSYFIHKLREDFKNMNIVLTSTTGVSSFNLGAQTIHSFSGIGAMKKTDKLETVMKKVKRKLSLAAIHACHVLVIDEISMLGKSYLEMLDKVFRTVRKSDEVMGGIQIIFTGDFLQLPPIDDDFCFESEVWANLVLKTIHLTKMHRVNDPIYTSLLERVRVGKHTPDDNQVLYKRYFAYKEMSEQDEKDDEKDECRILPTFLYSKRMDVDEKNMEELRKNPNEMLIFKPVFVPGKGRQNVNELSPLYMKVGAQVMLNVNMDCENGLVNGSRGVVIGYGNDMLDVKFLNGSVLSFNRHEFITEEDGQVMHKIVQFPFILAYALTIHKVQGCTLDYAVIDIGHSVFESNMSYVALSRVRNLEGLFLKAFQPHKIFCNQKALSFYENNH